MEAQRKQAVQIIGAIAEVIREVGEVPSGHLYARLMGKLDLAQYNVCIDVLKKAGLVKEERNLLTWIGE